MLQRLTEELEYSELLDKAAACETSTEQMCYVAAFTTSSYSTTASRTGKPFNPLLGETFEFDRTEDLGWRSLAEQVKWDLEFSVMLYLNEGFDPVIDYLVAYITFCKLYVQCVSENSRVCVKLSRTERGNGLPGFPNSSYFH